MAIVTGDRYLDSLVKFVDNHADSLIEGTLVLKLNPVGLRYVQSRLEALAELESLLAGAPVDYLRAYVSDLGDHRALEQLRRILRLLPSLKVVSVLPLGRDPTPLYLLPFGRLKVLELRGCDLSTSAAKGLLELRVTLEKLICHDSTDALRHVFASRIAEIKDSHQWNRLSFVSCACNGLVLMDESLQLLPVVETLDLSRNKCATVDNLRKCTKLKHVDLGYNNLRSIASFSEVSCQIVKLVLRNNALTSLRGIENLKSLQGLDLSYNIISNFSEIEILAGFSSLQNLWLEGNPICCARWFRPQVFSLFYQPYQVKLDEKKISTSEFWKRQIIIASREKQPASFGFYLPIQDDADTPGNLNTKRKRISRLVSIEDNEHGPCTSSDLDSPSCDNQSPSRDENPNTDQEAEIEDLVTRIEFLKKDRSVLWLQELKEWMNRTFENSVDGNKFRSTIFDKSNIIHLKSQTNDGDLAESSRNIYDSFKLSGDESSSVILESETSFADTSTGVGSQRYLDQIGGSTSISFMGQDEGGGILFKNLNLDEQFLFNNEGSLFADAGEVNSHEGPTEENVTTEHFTSTSSALNDISESYSSSAYPGSPPHYQEDILQRRHNLEEEILQLSAESFSLASSESNTSCSEDDSELVSHPIAEVDHFGVDISPERRHNGFFKDSHRVDVGKSYVDNILALKANGTNIVRQDAEGKFVRTNTGELHSGSLSNVLHDDEGLGFGKGKTDFLEKMKLRRKSRRRMVSLPEEEDVHGDTDSSKKSSDHVDHSRSDMSHEGQVSCSGEVLESTLAGNCDDRAVTTPSAGKDDFIVTFFNSNVASSLVNETCREYVQCHCLHVEGSAYNEREVAILRSSEQKLYVLVDNACDGSG